MVYVQLVVEEELIGNGVLQIYLCGYIVDVVLIFELMDEELICVNVGVLWFMVEVWGFLIYVCEMGVGINVIDVVYCVIVSLCDIENCWNVEVVVYFEIVGVDYLINMNIGMIEGGDWGFLVLVWCWFQVCILIYVGQNVQVKYVEICDYIVGFVCGDRFLNQNLLVLIQNGFNVEGYVLVLGLDVEVLLGQVYEIVFGMLLKILFFGVYLDVWVYVFYN